MMEMARRSAPPPAPPLLIWRERATIDRLVQERQLLALRISRLRPQAHYRLVLEARLIEMTTRQMHLEAALKEGDG